MSWGSANFKVEINQPDSKSGPIYEHLQKFGPGMHRVAFAVKDVLDEKRAALEQKGGKWTAGARGGVAAATPMSI